AGRTGGDARGLGAFAGVRRRVGPGFAGAAVSTGVGAGGGPAGRGETPRIGIVGAGAMGRVHLKHYLAVGGSQVVAVCDPSAEAAGRLTRWACEQGVEGLRVYGDVETFLDAESPDAISVCTPPSTHVAAVGSALRRGIPVLCEKPPARTAAELEELAIAAGEDAVLQFGMCHVFHPPVQE